LAALTADELRLRLALTDERLASIVESSKEGESVEKALLAGLRRFVED
jgi:hypothetical protein